MGQVGLKVNVDPMYICTSICISGLFFLFSWKLIFLTFVHKVDFFVVENEQIFLPLDFECEKKNQDKGKQLFILLLSWTTIFDAVGIQK